MRNTEQRAETIKHRCICERIVELQRDNQLLKTLL